jgi:hypothetical protein
MKMRLQDVLQMPEKSWTQKGNGVQTTIMAIEPASQDGDFGWKQVVTVKDLTNDQAKITLQTKYPESLLKEQNIGQAATWRLKWYQGKFQKRIVGYPEVISKVQGGQPEPYTAQNPPQSPPQPTQAANCPQTQKYTERDACICRQCAGKVAGEVVAAYMTSMPADESYSLQQAINDLLEVSDVMAMYFLEGVSKASDPEMVGADPNNFLPDGTPL